MKSLEIGGIYVDDDDLDEDERHYLVLDFVRDTSSGTRAIVYVLEEGETFDVSPFIMARHVRRVL